MKKKTVVLLICLASILAIALVYFIFTRDSDRNIVIETAKATMGSIQNTVTATGTIEPTEKVEVGTQVSGVVQKILVDYNSKVKKGQLIAELDKTLLTSQLRQNRALLLSARNEISFQKKNYDRISQIFEKGLISQEELDKAQYSYQQAVVSEEKAMADLERAESNLRYATIYSPIDGIVLSRAVDEGQTVAASLNAPTLFTIARDLTRMEVLANVDEADIGQILQGQRVTFSVDAYPEKIFEGRVSQVRLEPKVVSNVVTYTITVDAQNPDQQLLPGMTASITVYTREAQNVVTIPVKAIRFKPDRDVMKLYMKQQGISDKNNRGRADSRERRPDMPDQRSKQPGNQTRVWISQDNKLRPVQVKLGISDGSLTAVVEGLEEGTDVVIAMEQKSKTSSTTDSSGKTNPFMPRFPRRGAGPGGRH